MEILKYITLILFAFAIGLGFYINLLYVRMYPDATAGNNRVSLKRLNGAIATEADQQRLTQLHSLKKLHVIYLYVFYSTLLLMFVVLAINMK